MGLGLGFVGSCIKLNTGRTQVKYASLTPPETEKTPLMQINKTGKLGICIAVYGYERGAATIKVAEIQAHIARAIHDWTTLLKGHKKWRPTNVRLQFKSNIDLTETCGKPDSPASQGSDPDRDIKIFKWAQQKGFLDFSQNYYRQQGFKIPVTRSFSLVSQRKVILDHHDENLPFVLLHEIGHLFGVGDTYVETGYQTKIGEHPPSVMNGKSKTLTADDRNGIWSVLDNAINGTHACKTGHTQYKTQTGRSSDQLYCVPNLDKNGAVVKGRNTQPSCPHGLIYSDILAKCIQKGQVCTIELASIYQPYQALNTSQDDCTNRICKFYQTNKKYNSWLTCKFTANGQTHVLFTNHQDGSPQ